MESKLLAWISFLKKFRKEKSPFAEVELLYHTSDGLSIVFFIFFRFVQTLRADVLVYK